MVTDPLHLLIIIIRETEKKEVDALYIIMTIFFFKNLDIIISVQLTDKTCSITN